jgi:uncharacterized membrane protein YeaQ/YmgE (transglycosylase-associated protein family)
MTGDVFLAAVLAGLFGGCLAGIVMGPGGYGVVGDLGVGLLGSTVAVLIFQATGWFAYAGMSGAVVAAFVGSAGVLVAQRTRWFAARDEP